MSQEEGNTHMNLTPIVITKERRRMVGSTGTTQVWRNMCTLITGSGSGSHDWRGKFQFSEVLQVTGVHYADDQGNHVIMKTELMNKAVIYSSISDSDSDSLRHTKVFDVWHAAAIKLNHFLLHHRSWIFWQSRKIFFTSLWRTDKLYMKYAPS